MESLNGKEPLSENEEETLVGEVIREVGEIAYWKAKAEEWRNVALESRLELEEFQNESRYKTHSTLPIRHLLDGRNNHHLLFLLYLLRYLLAMLAYCHS